MFSPVPMLKLHALVLEKHVELLTQELGELGDVHLLDAVRQSPEHLLEEVDWSNEVRDQELAAQQCRMLCAQLGLDSASDADPAGLPPAEIRERLKQVEDEYATEESEINRLLTESGTLTQEITRLSELPYRQIRFAELRDLSHLMILAGRLPLQVLPELIQALGERAMVLRQPEDVGTVQVMIVSSRKNRWAIESDLAKFGFQSIDPPDGLDESAESELVVLNERLLGARTALEKHRTKILHLKEVWGDLVLRIQTQVDERLRLLKAQMHFGKTTSLFCISGWIPEADRDKVNSIVDETTRGIGIVEYIQPTDDEMVKGGVDRVPVKFRESLVLRPFQQLIAMFGAPRYDEVEPSLFVALSFVLMFGVMFGDVGQGLILVLLGVHCLKSKRQFVVEKLRDAAYWLLFCGLSGMLFGVLFGSFFGYEYGHHTPRFLAWLPKPVLEPINDPMKLFAACLGMGIVFIVVGMAINIYNRLRKRDYFEGLLDKCGLIGVILYLGSIGLGIKAALGGATTGVEVWVLVLIPLIILFIREPLYNFLARKKHIMHDDLLTFIITSAIEIMETVSSLIGNTVSFARLGGFALSHAALCLAIYKVADLLHDLPGGGLWVVLTLIIGNIFVILMEGMVVTIQGIRLQYYELFSKYFAGDGVLYAPFRLRKQKSAD